VLPRQVLGAEEAALVVTIVSAHGGLAVLLSRRVDDLSTRAGYLGCRPVPRGCFDRFEARTRPPALAEPSTTMIMGALTRATEGFTTGAPSSHAGSQ
jgi:hypothetical protein